jgi:uracil-DNA glycosylase
MSKWKSIFGSWDTFFEDIISNKEVSNNLNIIRSYYNGSSIIYPSASNIFKAFKECPYDKLSVVIVLQDPYHDGSATGIAMGNNTLQFRISPTLRVVKDTISKTIYNSEEFYFDSSLIKWSNQGVLLFNTALTVEKGKPLSHQHLWSTFTELFLKKLNTINSGIIYCLWGKHAEFYKQYINLSSNTVLITTHPMYSVYRGSPWDCNHFVEINRILKENNNLYINW